MIFKTTIFPYVYNTNVISNNINNYLNHNGNIDSIFLHLMLAFYPIRWKEDLIIMHL